MARDCSYEVWERLNRDEGPDYSYIHPRVERDKLGRFLPRDWGYPEETEDEGGEPGDTA